MDEQLKSWPCQPVDTKELSNWQPWQCWIMNLIDFRHWFCDCTYMAPWGKVISPDCEEERHYRPSNL